jgi:tripartite-type tricarboxylate transporter receptor subunit TctC
MARSLSVKLVAILSFGITFVVGSQHAQGEGVDKFPSKPIHIVVPAAPGGVNDILARLIGQKLTERFGYPVVVENRAGAGTILGASYVARALPDGYTLLNAPLSTIAINPAIYTKLSYDPKRDFVPIINIASYPYILCVTNSASPRTVRELIDYTKANPKQANAGGAASIFLLMTELFKQKTSAQIQYVPFRGSNDAAVALISGELLLSFVDSGPASPQIKGGRFRALAVTSESRMQSFPDIPTLSEAGVSGMVVESWSGLFTPTGTPAGIVKKLQDEIIQIVQMPDIQERLRALELNPVGSTSEEFARTIAKDTETWSGVATAAKIKIGQ